MLLAITMPLYVTPVLNAHIAHVYVCVCAPLGERLKEASKIIVCNRDLLSQ